MNIFKAERFFNIFSGNRPLKKWVFSYFIIIIVIMIITIIGNLLTYNVSRVEINAANNRLVMQMQKLYDSYFDEVEKNAYVLVNSLTVKHIIDKRDISRADRTDLVRTTITDVSRVVHNSKILSDIFIVFRDEDACINSGAMFNKEILYESFFSEYYESRQECIDDLSNYPSRGYKIIKSQNGEFKILYIDKPAIDRPVFIVMEIDQRGAIEHLRGGEFGHVLLTDDEENVIITNSDIAFSESLNLPPVEVSGKVTNYDSGKYILGFIDSTVFPGKYVHMVDKTIYYRTITTTNRILLFSYLLCLLVSGVLAYVLAMRNYKPIDKLLNKIELDEKKSRIRENTIKNILLYNFVLGKINYNSKEFALFALDFKGRYNALVLFNITEFGIHENDENGHAMAMLNISNVLTELVSDFATAYYCELDGLYLCFLNFTISSPLREMVVEKIEYAKDFLNIHLGLNFSYVVSDVFDGVSETPKNYEMVLGKMSSDILFNDQIDLDKQGEETDARSQNIKQHIEENFHDGNLSVNSIAEHFGLSFNYISKYFKAQTGEGLARYIVYRRIEEGKKLLRETGDNLNVIAKKTGFYSASTFIRTFKKLEDVTPGQYRDTNKGQ